MGWGIGKRLKKAGRSIDKATAGEIKAAGKSTEREIKSAGRTVDEAHRKTNPLRAGGDALSGLMPEEAAIPEPDAPIAIPDEELSRTARRRSRAKRRGGRSSSILTGSDSLG